MNKSYNPILLLGGNGIRLNDKTYHTDASDQDASVIRLRYYDPLVGHNIIGSINPDVSVLYQDVSR